jgi:ABC-type glycerol-3-phosphate transport system substrate-binding protein
MSDRALSRRTFLVIFGTGLATTLTTACGSTSPSSPTMASTAVPVPTATAKPALQSTLAPTLAPAATAAPAAPRQPSAIQIAIPSGFFTYGLATRLANAVNKVPSTQLPELKIVQLPMEKAGVGPRTAAEYGSRYAEQLAAAGFDTNLILLENTTLRTAARAGLLRDLGPMLQKQPWFVPGDYWGNILQAGMVAGKQYGVPLDASVELLVYHRDRLKQVGVPEPLDWTWEQLITAAQKLSGDGQWGFRVSDWSPSIFTLAWQNGAQVIDAQGKLQVTEPGMIKALEFLDNFAHIRKASAPLEAMDLASGSDNPFNISLGYLADKLPYLASLGSGQTAMMAGQSKLKDAGDSWWEPEGNAPGVSEVASSLGATVLPRGDHPTALGAVWTILGIPAKATDPDRSLNALHALRDVIRETLVPAMRKPTPNLRAVSGRMTERDAEVIGASLDVARFLPGDLDLTTLELVASKLVLPVVTGKKKPQDAANDAQMAIDAALA